MLKRYVFSLLHRLAGLLRPGRGKAGNSLSTSCWVALGGMVAAWGGLLAAWDGLLVATL